MKTSALLAALLSTGCAATGWAPDTLAPKQIDMRFVNDDEWAAYQEKRKGCSDCFFAWRDVLGTAEWDGGICVVRFPASRGMPSHHVFAHEVRHCYEGSHSDWSADTEEWE